MRMYKWSGQTEADGDLEAGIVIHEVGIACYILVVSANRCSPLYSTRTASVQD